MCQPLAILVELPRVIESKISIIFCCIKACMNLNGTKCIVDMDGKNFEKDQKSFSTVKTWQKHTWRRLAVLETLQTVIFL